MSTKNYRYVQLALVCCVLVFPSCSKKEAIEAGDVPAANSSVAKADTPTENLAENAKTKLAWLATDFERVNDLETPEARKEFCVEYGQTFFEFAKEFPGTKSASDALCYVIGLGDDKLKAEATRQVLSLAEDDLDSEYSIELLQAIVRDGNGPLRETAISYLIQIAFSSRSDASVASLLALATVKTLPDDVRKEALDKWVNEFIDHEKTEEAIQLLGSHQCAINESSLKKIAIHAKGELKAQAVVRLALYLNRRHSVREFYKDAPPFRFEGMLDETKNYLAVEIDPNESSQLIGLLKSIESKDKKLMATARRELFAIENLAIGKTVPEIEGSDLDEEKFKLSDYRGQVVLLSFWGDW